MKGEKKNPFDNPTDAHRYPYGNPTQTLGGDEEIRLNTSFYFISSSEWQRGPPLSKQVHKVQPGTTFPVTPRVRILDFFFVGFLFC